MTACCDRNHNPVVERLVTGGFMMLNRQLLSGPDVCITTEERRYLVGCCPRSPRDRHLFQRVGNKSGPFQFGGVEYAVGNVHVSNPLQHQTGQLGGFRMMLQPLQRGNEIFPIGCRRRTAPPLAVSNDT